MRIPLEVWLPDRAARARTRRREPITLGLPFARGLVASLELVRLYDATRICLVTAEQEVT